MFGIARNLVSESAETVMRSRIVISPRYGLAQWARVLLSGRPHFVIRGPSALVPYLRRWYLLPRNRWMNVYLHQILHDDDDRAVHDHPWWFVSLVLKNGYRELTDAGWVWRMPWSLAFRKAEHRHRIELFNTPSGHSLDCWTLVITGPVVRKWGFWPLGGFVPYDKWEEYTNPPLARSRIEKAAHGLQ